MTESHAPDFTPPPRLQNHKGEPRRFGFEFELAGLDIPQCSELIAVLFAGEVVSQQSLEATVTNTAYGDFRVELDARMIKNLISQLEAGGEAASVEYPTWERLKTRLSEWVGDMAKQVVPFEIVCPPLPLEALDTLEELRERLRHHQAQGTRAAFTNAFGTHINAEAASLEVDYIRDMLRAFLILYPWLRKVMAVDVSRRLLTFIDPFPHAYVMLVLNEHYQPDMGEFIRDYIKYNPTRNRALDLLPLFAHLKPEALDQLDETSHAQVCPRPTFHYRLPNCEMDNANWRISQDWAYWVEVERLADDKDMLAQMAADYCTSLSRPLTFITDDWLERLHTEYGYAL